MKTHRILTTRLPLAAVTLITALAATTLAQADPFFVPGNLVVSTSTYTTPASDITVGQALPGGGTAVSDASYPNVFNNETPDPSFGITEQISLQQLTTSGALVNTLAIPTSDLVTSISSKSELALNLSSDGSEITFMGYVAPANTLDVSNSNTPAVNDPTNPVSLTYQRGIGTVDASGNVSVTAVNAYSGNNGRAAVLENGNFYTVGNAGNSGSGTTNATFDQLSANTGVQMIAQGSNGNTTTVGKYQGNGTGNSNGDQYGFSITQAGFSADKTGKDDNFRGMTVFNNTIYVTKGSGSNGINTVYQLNPNGGGYVNAGTGAGLSTSSTASSTSINILPGFSTTSAKTGKNANGTTGTVYHPFGLWFANATTLYVADEGDGVYGNAISGFGGLQKWSFDGSQWNLDYTLTNGLSLGQEYVVSGYPTGQNSATSKDWAPETDGLRNITGVVNADGTVTIYGVTSTVSGSTDNGADPNKLVAITDTLGDSTLTQASGENFSTLETAAAGQVLRGVTFAPQAVPEPGSCALLLGALGSVLLKRRSRNASR